jgi:hypothetical protein
METEGAYVRQGWRALGPFVKAVKLTVEFYKSEALLRLGTVPDLSASPDYRMADCEPFSIRRSMNWYKFKAVKIYGVRTLYAKSDTRRSYWTGLNYLPRPRLRRLIYFLYYK